MHKKILFSLAIATLTLSLAACGGTASTTSNSTTEVSENVSSVSSGDSSSEITAESSASESESAETGGVTSTFAEGTAGAELAALYNGGFTMGSFGSDENGTVVNYYNEDHSEFRQATCTMTDEQSSQFFDMDWEAADYNQQCFDLLTSCDDLAVITSQLPDMTEYEAFIGKTVGEAEDAGFDLANYDTDENDNMFLEFYVYTDAGDTYTLRVTPDIAEDDDTIYDDESIKDLTIKELVFWNFN